MIRSNSWKCQVNCVILTNE